MDLFVCCAVIQEEKRVRALKEEIVILKLLLRNCLRLAIFFFAHTTFRHTDRKVTVNFSTLAHLQRRRRRQHENWEREEEKIKRRRIIFLFMFKHRS